MSNNSNNNANTTDEVAEAALYDRWRALCVAKLKDKLNLNVEKRQKNFEDVVTNAAHIMARDKTLELVPNFPSFRISATVKTEALDRMYSTIESWPGVHLSQCKKLPPIFKKYWRIADNWWNRQKGKWFGDLFFWPILHYNLHQYTKKILVHKNDQIQFDSAYFIFLCDILHSKVSFKKARPNPLIFDLALEKSPKLQQWFTSAGQQHGIIWEISSKTTKKSIKDYAQSWVKAVKDSKYCAYVHFQTVNAAHDPEISKVLNVFPNIHSSTSSNNKSKRNSGSHKSNESFSIHSCTDNEYEIDKDSPPTPTNIATNTNTNNNKDTTNNISAQQRSNSQQEYLRLMDECNALKVALHQQQQQQHMMAQALSEMQVHQMYKDQYIQQQQMAYMQHMHEAQLYAMHNNHNTNNSYQAPITPSVKQEPNMIYNNMDETAHYPYCYDAAAANINQPEFLPPAPRYAQSNITPPPQQIPIIPLPPPLKTDAGKERRQSYHDVLKMKQYFAMMQQQDVNSVKPESIHSLHTNHSTLTTASHTTVVSNAAHMNAMPPNANAAHSMRQSSIGASTPSGSEASGLNKFYYNPLRAQHNQYHYNANNPAIAALPTLHIYNQQHAQQQQQHHYHLPPPVIPSQQPQQMMPLSLSPKQNSNILPPPMNGSRRASQMMSHSSKNNSADIAIENAMDDADFVDSFEPFEAEMMDMSMNNLLAPMGAMSGSNLSLSNSNNLMYDVMDTAFSMPNNNDMSISNCLMNSNSNQ